MTAGKTFKRLVRARARRTGESYSTARHWLLAHRGRGGSRVVENLVRVELEAIKEQVAGDYAGQPVVFLRELGGDRRVYIVIGRQEGLAIARAMEGQVLARPWTHDMLSQTVDALGGHVDRVVIRSRDADELPYRQIFLADVVVTRGDEAATLDCRPSDALALAVRRQPVPPIMVDESLFEDAVANG